MIAPELIWWCDRARMAIAQERPDGGRPSCGPDEQCRAGEKAGSPCGWYQLVPAGPPAPVIEPEVEAYLEPPGWEPPESLTVDEVIEMAAAQADAPETVVAGLEVFGVDVGPAVVEDTQERPLEAELMAPAPGPGFHMEEGWFVCDECGDDFQKRSGIKTHLRLHVKPEPCPHGCGKMVKPGQGVTRHVRAGCPALAGGPPPEPEPTPEPEPEVEPPPPPPPAAAVPRSSPRRPARTVSREATRAARTEARAKRPEPAEPRRRRRAAAEPAEDAPPPPLQARSSWKCAWVDEAGVCGREKEPDDVGWKRRRRPGGHADLCPDHSDATDAEVDELLEVLATA